ncbi:MAG: CidA/LrgA family protein, partial [Betaproteobacteria bacterium]|nr:CidA/LrgA family protein [Betaproteobacteria bacterium]
MIAGLVQILLFQGLGEIVARFFLPLIPGPVIGLVLLLAWLRVRGS